ncbi:MAG: cation-transporting P-type ATPase, partial [bacterium]|nr:cation-transporting P-type ATPase [bacterium]
MVVPFYEYASKDKNQVINELASSLTEGLSLPEVARRQSKNGWNGIKRRDVGIREIVFKQITSPFVILLCIASLISFFAEGWVNASIIIGIVLINALLGFYQEYSAHREISMLRDHIISYLKVLRNGQVTMVQSKELVVGDIIFVEPGNIIPADIRFIDSYNLLIDESLLTGESVPVKKNDEPLEKSTKEIFQASNIGFSGTSIVAGKGIGIVYAIGDQTVLVDIARLSQSIVQESILTKDIRRFSTFMIYIIIITLFFVVGAHFFINPGSISILTLFLFALALAVGITPEALPIVITFGLSRGARVLAKNKVIVKRLEAIEDLGSVEVLCTDKTGTLTENIMTLSSVYSGDLVKTKALAMLTGSLEALSSTSLVTNSFDVAVMNSLTDEEKVAWGNYKKIFDIPYDQKLRMNASIAENNGERLLIVRGSSVDVLQRCRVIQGKEAAITWLKDQGKKGKRVLAVAEKKLMDNNEPTFDDLDFIGLISFEDPLKKTTLPAIEKAKKLGLVIKIITGDAPEVAEAVARQLNLMPSHQSVITEEMFAKFSDKEKGNTVESHTVFSRISPENKYTIVQILQKKYKVAFLGDGINDMPALKIAHVGISVSGAVDIAREAADIILLKKSLYVMINAIEEGRKVFV